MNVITVIYYLFSILAGFFGFIYATNLKKKYSLPFLSSYLHFLLAYNTLNFLNWIGFKLFHAFSIDRYYGIMMLFTTPVIPLMFFFFFQMFLDLLEIRLAKKYYHLFILAFVLFLAANLFSILNIFRKGGFYFIRKNQTYLNFSGIVIMILIPAVFLALSWRQQDPFKRAWRSGFSLLFLVIMMILYLVPLSWFRFHMGGQTVDLLAFLFFAAPILPLYYAKSYLKRYVRRNNLPERDSLNMEVFCQQYSISRRERDVLELLIQGKSRKEMDETLFISVKTVNVHLYSIYQKLGVKNRIEVMNLVQNFKKAQPIPVAGEKVTKI